MTNPTVSIGLPVFNGAPFIERAIRSLLSQDFKDFELIVADNASIDATLTLIKKYAALDNRIKYFSHTQNHPVEFNFEFVKEKSRGEYFMWAAHDDTWQNNHLSLAVKYLKKDKSIDFVFPTFKLQSINLKFSKRIDKKIFQFIESENVKERVLGFANLHHSSHKCNLVYSLFRRQLLQQVYEGQDVSNDGLLSSLLLAKSKGKVSDQYTFRKRYKYYWPGFLSSYVYLLKRLFRIDISEHKFEVQKQEYFDAVILSFPQYEQKLREIDNSYLMNKYLKNYKIKNL